MATETALVSGAGIVGSAAALALARSGYSVEIVEPHPPRRERGRLGVDPRTVALAPSTVDWLRELVPELRVESQAIERMQIWEEIGTGSVDFAASEIDRRELAHVFEHSAIAHALWTEASQIATCVSVQPIAELDRATLRSRLADGQVVAPSLLVVAEGSRSRTAELAGGVSRRIGPEGVAIATAVRSSRDHEGLAIQRFADGPLALLPMSEPHLLSLIWSTSKNKAKAILEMNDVAFLHAVNAASEGVCGKIVEADRRYSLPVFQQVVSSLHPCPGAVLVGDTARTIHPLAGFGVNLGIEDVRSLETRALAGAGGLSGWARQRQLRSRMMTTLMWSFERLWGARGAYALWARNSGVKWFNEFSALKRLIMREATGETSWTQCL